MAGSFMLSAPVVGSSCLGVKGTMLWPGLSTVAEEPPGTGLWGRQHELREEDREDAVGS